MLFVILLGIAVQAQMVGTNSVAGFTSYAQGQVWQFEVTRTALARSPDWDDHSETPPLSPREAIRIGQRQLRELVTTVDGWRLDSVSLRPLNPPTKWVYLVEFEEPPPRPEGGIHSSLRLVVLMDGSTVMPVRSAQPGPDPQPNEPHAGTLRPQMISIREVHLKGGGELPDAQALMRKMLRAHTYSPSSLAVEVSNRVQLLYQNNGYLHAEVSVPETTPVDSTAMDVTLNVNAGLQYHLKDIRFAGGKAFTPIQLRGLFPLQPGDVFDVGKVRGGFDAMRRLYLTKGYVNFTAIPEERFDERGRTMLLVISVQEGKVFRFGALMLSGVEPAPGVGKKVLADWNTYIGRVFDIREVEQFIHEHVLLLKIQSTDSFWSHVDFKLDEKRGISNVLLLFPTKLTE
jgi:hypothetical protein